MTTIIDAESIIVNLVEQFCNNDNIVSNAKEDLAFATTLQIRCDNNGYVNNTYHAKYESHYSKFIHIIINNSRRVFIAVNDEINIFKVDPSEFENTSNHDSCWQSDGLNIISQEYFKSYNACYDNVPEKHRVPPILADINGIFSPFFRPIVNYARIEYTDDESPNNISGYFKKLISIRKVNFTIHVED